MKIKCKVISSYNDDDWLDQWKLTCINECRKYSKGLCISFVWLLQANL